jgi:hypothetical protein
VTRRRPVVAPARQSHLARSTTWAGLRRGDPVVITGSPRRASWAFVAHVRNRSTGEEWVEVVGGRAGEHMVRSFPPQQVFPPGGRPGSDTVSLADAPRLPLG